MMGSRPKFAQDEKKIIKVKVKRGILIQKKDFSHISHTLHVEMYN